MVIEAGARLERSTVRGPAVIGAGARLSDAYVGPYTAVGEGCVIDGAEVEHSILLAGCTVCGPRRAHGVLAARSQRRRPPRQRQPRAYRFMVGDNCEIVDPVTGMGSVRGAARRCCADTTCWRGAGERGRASSRARGRRASLAIARARRRVDGGGARLCGERTPEAVVNCAAWTDVDGAESDAAVAYAVNGEGAGQRGASGRGARRAPGARLQRLRLRRGLRGAAVRESDPTAPRSVYGESKLAGEQAVLAAGGDT